MENATAFFENLYADFNDRKIDLVINNITENVKWANGIEGGHVHGHEGVREYWVRQFGMVHPRVMPLKIEEEDGIIKIKVHQVVHDLNGNLLANEIVEHFFTIADNKIAEFNIGEKATSN